MAISGGFRRSTGRIREMVVDFDGRLVPYASSELDEIVLAYAISVHKSQGSEYPAVILPLTTQHYLLLQRNLIYTGITRAKRLMVLIGSKKALGIAIHHNKPRSRYYLPLGTIERHSPVKNIIRIPYRNASH